jgi:hypothetical protein
MTVMGSRADISWTRTGLIVLIAATLVTGCTSAAGTSSSEASSGAPAATPTLAATATATSETPLPTGVPTTTDPCMLVTPQEASTLTGGSFSAGQEQTTSGNGKLCTYGEEGIALEVLFGIAASASVAAAGEQAWKAELEKASGFGLTLKEMPGFATGADAATIEGSKMISGVSVSVVAIYVLRGTSFFAISDVATLGSKPPTSADLESQAMVTLTRIP